MVHKIVNIRLRKNGIIYAELVDDSEKLIISATLNYILQAVKERNLKVENVKIKR